MTIHLHFVCSSDPISRSIVLATGGWCCHVEALSLDGQSYIGAHMNGGVKARPLDYATWDKELLLDLPADGPMTADFYSFLNRHLNEPYDHQAILGFAAHIDLHAPHHTICSAFMALGLRQCGWFANPLGIPAHQISPRDLLLIIAGRIAVGPPKENSL